MKARKKSENGLVGGRLCGPHSLKIFSHWCTIESSSSIGPSIAIIHLLVGKMANNYLDSLEDTIPNDLGLPSTVAEEAVSICNDTDVTTIPQVNHHVRSTFSSEGKRSRPDDDSSFEGASASASTNADADANADDDGNSKKSRTRPSLGRRGDPRMHRAVAARLANPQMKLVDALRMGGFDVDGNREPDALVKLGQRKNQLSRRLRLSRQSMASASLSTARADLGSMGISATSNQASANTTTSFASRNYGPMNIAPVLNINDDSKKKSMLMNHPQMSLGNKVPMNNDGIGVKANHSGQDHFYFTGMNNISTKPQSQQHFIVDENTGVDLMYNDKPMIQREFSESINTNTNDNKSSENFGSFSMGGSMWNTGFSSDHHFGMKTNMQRNNIGDIDRLNYRNNVPDMPTNLSQQKFMMYQQHPLNHVSSMDVRQPQNQFSSLKANTSFKDHSLVASKSNHYNIQDLTETNSLDSTSIKTKFLSALNVFRAENSSLLKRCMLIAGFEPNETNECDSAYITFSSIVVETELRRIQRLRSTYLVDIDQNVLREVTGVENSVIFSEQEASGKPHITPSAEPVVKHHDHSHSHNHKHDNGSHLDVTSRDFIDNSDNPKSASSKCFQGRHVHQLQGRCGHKPIIHKPRGGLPHVDFLVNGKVECYQKFLPVLPSGKAPESDGALWPSQFSCNELGDCKHSETETSAVSLTKMYLVMIFPVVIDLPSMFYSQSQVSCGTRCQDGCGLVADYTPEVLNLNDIEIDSEEWNTEFFSDKEKGNDEVLMSLMKLGDGKL